MQLRIVCLLPVRNGSGDLLDYFENVREFASGIIALDDGSIDSTLELLLKEPLVLDVLTNPRRPSSAGWNDAENRQRLLSACERYAPDWILWLDADELIAPSDIPLLRSLISDIARPESAYAFEVLRMIGDLKHFDKNKLWVFRLFPFSPGQRLPTARLHFQPIPTDITRERQYKTVIRILHKGGITSVARRARFRKYQEADPKMDWQDDYRQLLDAPGHLWELRPHHAGTAIVIS